MSANHYPAGVRELSPPVVNLKRLYNDHTTAAEPILILISPGTELILHSFIHHALCKTLFTLLAQTVDFFVFYFFNQKQGKAVYYF